MTRLLLEFFFIIGLSVKGQIQFASSCNQSTLTVNTFFLPSTTSVYSNTTIPMEVLYLCGPNTIVYDTITQYHNCRNVLINPGCTYYTNSAGCIWADFLLAKNSSTLVISSTANSNTIRIFYEVGATIINYTSGSGTQSFVCTSLSFPTGSCATNITEKNAEDYVFLIYPNPSNSKINIEAVNFHSQYVDISIFNQLGELMFHRKEWAVSEKEIPCEILSNGLYFIQVKTSRGQRTEKLIVNR